MKVTPIGGAVLSVILLALIIFSGKTIGENNSQAASDQAVIEKMVTETNSFVQRIRCIEDQAWDSAGSAGILPAE